MAIDCAMQMVILKAKTLAILSERMIQMGVCLKTET